MVKFALVTFGAVAWLIAAPVTFAAADTKQPLLSIAVDNGQTTVATGDQLTYTIKIHNIGTAAAKQLAISQTFPPGLAFVSADRGGSAKSGRVLWRIDLKAGEELALTTVAKVGKTPAEMLRLASVACATAKGDTKPRVCATHSDLLPIAAAPAKSNRAYSGLGVAVLVLMGLIAMVAVLRRMPHRVRAIRSLLTPRG